MKGYCISQCTDVKCMVLYYSAIISLALPRTWSTVCFKFHASFVSCLCSRFVSCLYYLCLCFLCFLALYNKSPPCTFIQPLPSFLWQTAYCPHHVSSLSPQCKPIPGHGFVLDKYKCQCRRGFYQHSRVALNGFSSECHVLIHTHYNACKFA